MLLKSEGTKMEEMTSETKGEILNAIRDRYRIASKAEKGRILHEFKLVTGYHRKHAIRL